MEHINFGLFVIRVVFGLFLFMHGWNKVSGPNGLAGTARWFGSIGMRWPQWQARIAASTEMGSGILFAAGFLTPFAAAGMIALMAVAIYTVHLKNGFFIFRPGEGWEYCGSIAAAAFGIASIGAGEWSIDHAIDFDVDGWWGALVAGILGVGGAALQLAVSYRPPKPVAADA